MDLEGTAASSKFMVAGSGEAIPTSKAIDFSMTNLQYWQVATL